MGKVRSKKIDPGPREVTPDVHKDKVARNLLNFKAPDYAKVSKNNKSRNRSIARGKLTLKKKEKEYTDKELGIPKLNTALDPVGVKVKGKKGKKFVNETTLQLILSEVQQEANEVHASKLERARQLETIRELKRKEIEEKELKQKEKLESKKRELKGGAKGAKPNANGGRGTKGSNEREPKDDFKKRGKRVSFA